MTVLDIAGDVVRFVHVGQCHHGIGVATIYIQHVTWMQDIMSCDAIRVCIPMYTYVYLYR